ncbi:MAG: hypothetical protein E7214_01150 [Clostridium sp.]|nr:hypothetical protein [Clostridium sp.]
MNLKILEKVSIRFKNIIKLFKCSSGLKVRSVGKAGGKGRISFIAKISEDNWVGKTAEFKDKHYRVNENTYDIHLELTFDIFNKLIKLPLHYETNPYIPKGKAINNSYPEDYNKYINRREKFKKKLHDKIHNLDNYNVKTYNGCNQIASINISIDNNVTVKEFLNIIEENCNLMNKLVEESLVEMTSYNK